ncbi:uncharacterized protein [Nicotiana sylvestris]|uniref:uncharacterized protein n=1 Tax=Nicotiana sylvestris TaxID=4096 RepID=UPI00388CCA83
MAIDMNIQELLVMGDLDLLIHQVREEWATKNSKILPYLHHVQDLRKRFTKIEFQHVPRVQTEFADALATLSSMIQHPGKNFIDPIPVNIYDQPAYCAHIEEEAADGKPWFNDIKEYLAKGEYPELANTTQKCMLQRLSNNFFHSGGILYRRTPDLGIRRIIQEAKLDNAKWMKSRYEQLALIDGKRMNAVCHGQLYQNRMSIAFNRRVKPR